MSHNGRRIRIPTGSLIGAQACSPVKPFVKPSPSCGGGLIDAAAVAKKVSENFVPRKFPAILIISAFLGCMFGVCMRVFGFGARSNHLQQRRRL